MSAAVVSDLRFYKHSGTVCRDAACAPPSRAGEAPWPRLPFPEPRIAMTPFHRASPRSRLSGFELALRSLPYSLALLEMQEQEVKGTIKRFYVGKEASSRTI